MNTEAIRTEIQKLVDGYQKSIRYARQYAPAKWQLAKLSELGISDLMPAKFGHGDANVVIAAAGQDKSAVMNAYGEGEEIDASTLYTLLHEVTPIKAPVTTETYVAGGGGNYGHYEIVVVNGIIVSHDWFDPYKNDQPAVKVDTLIGQQFKGEYVDGWMKKRPARDRIGL